MRTQVLDYLQDITLGGFNVSKELPRNESGDPLFLKNPRQIYTGEENKTVNVLLRTLDGVNISAETTTVEVVFANDAKNAPLNYADLVELIVQAKDIYPLGGFNTREASVETEIVDDVMVTRVELAYTKLR